MTTEMLHSVLEHFGFKDSNNRELLIMILRALQRQDAETSANYSEILREIRKMSETLQQQHDAILAQVQATNTEMVSIATNVAVLSKTMTDLETWFQNNSGVTNLVDFSDVSAAITSGKAALDAINTSVQNIAASPDPGAPVTPDFTLSLSPASLSVAQGANGNISVSSAAIGSFSDIANVAPGTLPAGVTLDATNYAVPAGSSAAIVVSVDATASTPGSYSIDFTGTDGNLSHVVTLALTITAPQTT